MVALSPTLKYKFLLLNGTYDRESDGLTAVDFVGPGDCMSILKDTFADSQCLGPSNDRSPQRNSAAQCHWINAFTAVHLTNAAADW